MTVEWECMEHWRNDTDREVLKYLGGGGGTSREETFFYKKTSPEGDQTRAWALIGIKVTLEQTLTELLPKQHTLGKDLRNISSQSYQTSI
jgi:hypothetical protein